MLTMQLGINRSAKTQQAMAMMRALAAQVKKIMDKRILVAGTLEEVSMII
jgi:hypothetical protein